MGRTVAFTTLGCKLNYSETSTLERMFLSAGYETVSPSKVADVYVINTCSVTEHSDKKCRNFIRRVHRINPDALIAVTGCYAQLKSDEILQMEGVDIVLGAQNKGDLFAEVSRLSGKGEKKVFSCEVNQIKSFFPAYSSGERTRSFLKVQDGCDYYCSYCTVPLARGHSRNIPVAELVEEAHRIAEEGIREIVLTGVNTGDFGRTTGETFLGLLQALNEVDGIERYRISSIEPNLLTEEVIKWIASGTKFLPHFHIPLQSGCDSVLARMRRRYNTKMFSDKISLVRSYMDSVFFGIDVIVGFPGETDECFNDTYQFLKQIRPAFIHVFPYSIRRNTPAAEMPGQVDESVKNERVRILEELSAELHNSFCDENIGQEKMVLFESTRKGGMMYGYTENYIRVEVPYDRSLIGKVSRLVLTEACVVKL